MIEKILSILWSAPELFHELAYRITGKVIVMTMVRESPSSVVFERKTFHIADGNIYRRQNCLTK